MKIFLTKLQSVLFVVKKDLIGFVLGGCDSLLLSLALFMIMEHLTQILIAFMNKKISVEIVFHEIAKKVCIFFLVAVGNTIDVLIMQNGNFIRTAVILFYLSNEGIMILENVEKLDLPIPQKLKDILEQFKHGKK